MEAFDNKLFTDQLRKNFRIKKKFFINKTSKIQNDTLFFSFYVCTYIVIQSTQTKLQTTRERAKKNTFINRQIRTSSSR